MPVERAEDQGPSFLSSPASAALTPGGGLDEDGTTGGSANSSFSKDTQSSATPVCPASAGPEEGTSGEL